MMYMLLICANLGHDYAVVLHQRGLSQNFITAHPKKNRKKES